MTDKPYPRPARLLGHDHDAKSEPSRLANQPVPPSSAGSDTRGAAARTGGSAGDSSKVNQPVPDSAGAGRSGPLRTVGMAAAARISPHAILARRSAHTRAMTTSA